MKTLLTLAHEIKSKTDATDAIEIRDAVSALMPCKMSDGLDDVTLTLDGCDWRFIREDSIDDIMQDELGSDEYILGLANASFLSSVLQIDIEAIEAMQKAEAFEAIGKLVITSGNLEEYQRQMVEWDGYGIHFSHYDHSEQSLSSQPYYMFKLG